MPFADYDDFAACERANDDKDDPSAYCAAIKRATEQLDGSPSEVAALGDVGLDAEALDALAEQSDEWVASGDGVWIDTGEANVIYQQETYDDYPQAAVENAQMALDARDETGNPNGCGTDVGWARANQLVNGESLSRETVGRMAAFRRHESNYDPDAGRDDCGWMMWKAWGGEEGISWAERIVDDTSEEQQAEGDGGGDGIVIRGLSEEALDSIRSKYNVEIDNE